MSEQNRTPQPLSSREAYEMAINGAAILDVRPGYETNYRTFDVPKVYFLEMKELKDLYHEVPKEETLIIADNAGIHSKELALFMQAQGYPHVAYLAGGVLAWVHEDFPLIKDIDFELNGGCACKVRPRKVK